MSRTTGPAEGGDAVGLEEGVLLLNAEPGLEGLDLVHHLGALDARVVLDGRHVGLVAVAHHLHTAHTHDHRQRQSSVEPKEGVPCLPR